MYNYTSEDGSGGGGLASALLLEKSNMLLLKLVTHDLGEEAGTI